MAAKQPKAISSCHAKSCPTRKAKAKAPPASRPAFTPSISPRRALTDARHAGAVERALEALETAAAAADAGLSEELLLEDVRLARHQIGEITGELDNEALYDRIFSTFCIGK